MIKLFNLITEDLSNPTNSIIDAEYSVPLSDYYDNKKFGMFNPISSIARILNIPVLISDKWYSEASFADATDVLDGDDDPALKNLKVRDIGLRILVGSSDRKKLLDAIQDEDIIDNEIQRDGWETNLISLKAWESDVLDDLDPNDKNDEDYLRLVNADIRKIQQYCKSKDGDTLYGNDECIEKYQK